MSAKWGEARAYFDKQLASADRGLCWAWPFGGRSHGYGQLQHAGATVAVHIVAWEEVYGGRLPEGYTLAHAVPAGSLHPVWPKCWNPYHRDPVPTRKTRSVKLGPEAKAEVIARRIAGESVAELSAEFGVTGSLIYKYVRQARQSY